MLYLLVAIIIIILFIYSLCIELTLGLERVTYQALETDPFIEVCYLVEQGVLDVDLNPGLSKFTVDGTAVCKQIVFPLE